MAKASTQSQKSQVQFDQLEARFLAAQEARNVAERFFQEVKAEAPASLETAKAHVKFAKLEDRYVKLDAALSTLCWEILRTRSKSPQAVALVCRAIDFLEPAGCSYGVDVYKMAFDNLAFAVTGREPAAVAIPC